MLPERETMMMLLFVSTKNPLWKTLLDVRSDDDISETLIANYIGVPRTTISNWKKNGAIGKYRGEPIDDRVFETVIKRINEDSRRRENGFSVLDSAQKRSA